MAGQKMNVVPAVLNTMNVQAAIEPGIAVTTAMTATVGRMRTIINKGGGLSRDFKGYRGNR